MNPRYSPFVIKFHLEKLLQLGLSEAEIAKEVGFGIQGYLGQETPAGILQPNSYRAIRLLYETNYHSQNDIQDVIASTESPSIYSAYLLNSETILDLLTKVSAFHRRCYPDNETGWYIEGQEVIFYLKMSEMEKGFASPQGSMVFVAQILRQFVGERPLKLVAGVSSRQLPDYDGFCRFASEQIYFGQNYSYLKIPLALAQARFAPINPLVNDFLEKNFREQFMEVSQEQDLAHLVLADVSKVIRNGNSARLLNVDAMADGYGLSRSSFYRRLDEQGTSFKAILEHARKSVSADLLQRTNLAVAEISDQLGYSNPLHLIALLSAGMVTLRHRTGLLVSTRTIRTGSPYPSE